MTELIGFISPGYEAWPLLVAKHHPTAQLAAEELQTYLQKITDRQVSIIQDPAETQSPYIELIYQEKASDGFVRQVSPTGIQLIGRSPRGLLCAAYDLLEELGCRWYSPGDLGERVPKARQAALPAGIKDVEPALAGRGLVLANPAYLEQAEEWVDWAGKNRFNTLCFAAAAGPGRAWRKVRKGVLRDLERRGMEAELGRGLEGLLPRYLFWRHKRFFRFDGSRRTPDGNLCPTNPDALQALQRRAARFFRANQGIRRFHVWPDLMAPGGWCRCASCRQLPPSDQVLLVVNALAEALRQVDPQASIAFPACQETLPAPVSVRPLDNVFLAFAPYGRCYAHTLDDGQCALNQKGYLARWHEQVAWFTDTGQPARAVEFYLDGALFKSMWPPLANMLGADIRAYAEAGCQHVSATLNGNRPWLRLPISAFLFARLVWEPDANVADWVADYGDHYFGGPADIWADYITELELASELLLDLTPEEAVGQEPGEGPGQVVLPLDPLRFAAGSIEARRAKLSALQQARRHVERAGELLERASRPGAGAKPRGRITRNQVLDREGRQYELISHLFAWFYRRQLVYCLAGEGVSRKEIGSAMAQARSELVQIIRWGRRERRSGQRHGRRQERRWWREYQRMCAGWRLDLDKVAHDLAGNPLMRALWRLRIKWRLLGRT